MEMIPDKDLERKIVEAEEESLANVKQSLTPAQIDEVSCCYY